MKPLLTFTILLPVLMIFIQAIIMVYVSVAILGKTGFLKVPLAGMEYSEAIFAASSIFSVLLISSAAAAPVFQTYKTLQNQSADLVVPLLTKSGHFFLVILFFEFIWIIFSVLSTKTFPFLGKLSKDIREGNVPLSVLTGITLIGFSLVCRTMAVEMIDLVTPHYLSFR